MRDKFWFWFWPLILAAGLYEASIAIQPHPRHITAIYIPWGAGAHEVRYQYDDYSTCGDLYGPGIDGLWRTYKDNTIIDTFPTEQEARERVERVCRPTP